jgi:UDP-N-acetylmuramoyl-tripeptide--D-alanyl-D-alanine ligase
MRPFSVRELIQRTGAVSHGFAGEITGFATDSRSIKPGDLFLAIRGQNVDGHEFAAAAYQAGAAAVLGEREVAGPCLVVPDLVQAIADFGRSLRNEFYGPVVGITGSAGKTTTKELTAAAFAALGPVLKSEGNRNTEYTSPLTWADLTEEHQSAVIEMGMRGFGQIAHLAAASMPTIAIITMIGSSHIEMVGSRAGIAQAKGEILEALPDSGFAILPADDDYLEVLADRTQAQILTFGFGPEADCRVIGYRALGWDRSLIRGTLGEEEWEVELPAVGRHQARNTAAALLAAVAAGADLSAAAASVAGAGLPPMRMERVEHQGAMFVLDFYNASPDSTAAAIQAISEVPVEGRRLAVLGEMKELGDFTEAGHRSVGEALALSGIEEVYLCGGPTSWIRDEALKRGYPAERIMGGDALDYEAIRGYLEGVKPKDAVLIKGSRALGLEKALPEGLNRG